jgi:hypothetical protein
LLSGPSASAFEDRSTPLTDTVFPVLNDPGPLNPPPPPGAPPVPPLLTLGILNVVSTLSAVSAPDAAATPFSLEIVVTAESSSVPRLRVAVSVSILMVEPALKLKLLGLPDAKEPAVGDLVTVASVPTP